jgi:hypothetical protein
MSQKNDGDDEPSADLWAPTRCHANARCRGSRAASHALAAHRPDRLDHRGRQQPDEERGVRQEPRLQEPGGDEQGRGDGDNAAARIVPRVPRETSERERREQHERGEACEQRLRARQRAHRERRLALADRLLPAP